MNYYEIPKDEAFLTREGIRGLNEDGSLSLIHSRAELDKAEKIVRITRTPDEQISDRLMDLADSMNTAYKIDSELWAEAARYHTVGSNLRYIKGLINGDDVALDRLSCRSETINEVISEEIDEAIRHLDASFRHTLGVPQDDLYPSE